MSRDTFKAKGVPVGVEERARAIADEFCPHGNYDHSDVIEAIIHALAQQPAAVDGLNAWRAAFIAERATRYRESGMAIEQARIHAETDATLMEKTTSQPQQPEADPRSTHRVWRGEWQPCYCEATDDHLLGREQPAAVKEDWRKKAAEWLESMAVEQETANQKWPEHAARYKAWRDRPNFLRYLVFQVLAAKQGGSDNDR